MFPGNNVRDVTTEGLEEVKRLLPVVLDAHLSLGKGASSHNTVLVAFVVARHMNEMTFPLHTTAHPPPPPIPAPLLLTHHIQWTV